MLLTVTPNAAVDKTFQLERFEFNRVHRPVGFRAVAGGKGINVARVFHALGGPVVATGFLGGHTGRFIADSLEEIGIPARFVPTRGESRTCIAILDTGAHSQTEVNENGPLVSEAEVSALRRRFTALMDEGVTRVALCGSLPPGCPDTLYADLIQESRARGVVVALDAAGAALCAGVSARPNLVKCNRLELASVLPKLGETPEEIAIRAASLLGGGTEAVAVTLGQPGAVAVTPAGAWFAESPSVSFVSAVGSGDAFLAAWLFHEARGELAPALLEWGVAAGAANAEVVGAGFCLPPDIERLRVGVQSRRILLPTELSSFLEPESRPV